MFKRHPFDIHAIGIKEQARDRDDDRRNGNELLNDIHIVGDDRRVGIHRTVDDTGIGIRHFGCLLVFDDDIFQKIFIFFISGDRS